MKTATDVGLQTWEADVTCGVWCQGGSVRWLKTDNPQYTDASDVWMRGDDAIAALESLRAELTEARKPDCRMCSYFMPRVHACCVPGIDCNNGDRFEDIFNTEPLRLYEKEGKV